MTAIDDADLWIRDPDFDMCLMPCGTSRLCCLPGDHTGSCLSDPVTYPPLVVTL